MNEDQKKWLLDLQSKGIRFETVSVNEKIWCKGAWEFKNDRKDYRIPAQSIPDIPDWRELCREMQSKGIYFYHQDVLDKHCVFGDFRENYSIKRQPIPEWKEEMTEEIKPDPREEIPHREQQIQWHEDMLYHLRTGEPMRDWEFRFVAGKEKSGWILFGSSEIPAWDEGEEYRRKPKEIAYYHCVISRLDKTTGLTITGVVTGFSKDDLESYVRGEKFKGQSTKFGPIVETTVEMED